MPKFKGQLSKTHFLSHCTSLSRSSRPLISIRAFSHFQLIFCVIKCFAMCAAERNFYLLPGFCSPHIKCTSAIRCHCDVNFSLSLSHTMVIRLKNIRIQYRVRGEVDKKWKKIGLKREFYWRLIERWWWMVKGEF